MVLTILHSWQFVIQLSLRFAHAYRLCPLKPAVHDVSCILTLTPVIAVPAFWQQRCLCDVINFHSVCREERRQTAFRGEKWVPCVVCWTSAPVLRPVKGKCWKVWGDMNLPECGWGESCCEGVGTYFKTWLFVLVKAYGDSSTTGDLSWTQPSRLGIGGLIKHTPSLVTPWGPWCWSLIQDVQSLQDWLEPCFFYFNSLFSCVLLSFSLCLNVCIFFALSLYPPKTAGVLHGCQEKERPCLFHCLSPFVSCTWINMGWAELLY